MNSASQSELAIRTAVVARLRILYPAARIIHELNVGGGSNRADVAAVTADLLVLVEIKSERDKLRRLPAQLRAFAPVCHVLIVAAHQRWCSSSPYPNCDAERIIAFNGAGHLWRYPTDLPWARPAITSTPWHHRMLQLLWADELRGVAGRHRVTASPRAPATAIARDIAALVPGRDIERAVCAALRARQFADADAPINTELAA